MELNNTTNVDTLEVPSDQHIKNFIVRCGWYIDAIAIETNKGQTLGKYISLITNINFQIAVCFSALFILFTPFTWFYWDYLQISYHMVDIFKVFQSWQQKTKILLILCSLLKYPTCLTELRLYITMMSEGEKIWGAISNRWV